MSTKNSLRKFDILTGAIICSLAAWVSFPATTIGQEEGTSSRRETEALKMVEESGGRVYKISAADSSREISYYLSSKPIGDEQLKNISAINEVIWLNLAGTDISNDGLKHLAGMPIKKLHLERTKIGDDGLKHLASFKDLAYLNIYDTKVTDAGLEHLKELKNLKKLYVWKTGVTEEGMKKLNETLADLEIVGELKLEPVVIEEPKEEPKEEAKKEEAKTDEKEAESKKAEAKPEPKKKKGKKKKAEAKQDADKPADSDKAPPADAKKDTAGKGKQ